MPASRSTRGGLGGLGAIFFLATLGAISYYVQLQSVPHERDVVRKAATALPRESTEDMPRALPWQDRLDLDAAKLVPFVGAAAPAGQAEPTKGPGQAEPPPDPSSGRLVQDLSDGHRIMFTLDPVMQDSALQIFRNREVPYAATIVLDLRDNAVLAMAGHSSMDPEVDQLEILTTAWAPAASTFKLVTAAALLGTDAARPTTRVCFNGGLHGIKDDQLRDDPSRDKQCETLTNAIAHSYNLVIGKLSLKHIDQTQLLESAKRMLYEKEIPFEFPVERSPAHIPADPIERAKVAAGFWNVDLSPLHGAVLASLFARAGVYQPPHVIARVMSPDGSDVTPSVPATERVLNKRVADAVGRMMVKTTTEGTARISFRDRQGNDYIPGVKVAGKTGSLTGRRAPALNYNWFIGYAPADSPEIAIAVLLANEPKWRIKAHYAARRMIQIYMQRREEIARHRDATVTTDGVVLPVRDGSGALIKRASDGRAAKQRKPGKLADANSNAPPDGGDPGESLPPPPTADGSPAAAPDKQADPLPPVPGPLPPTPEPKPGP